MSRGSNANGTTIISLISRVTICRFVECRCDRFTTETLIYFIFFRRFFFFFFFAIGVAALFLSLQVERLSETNEFQRLGGNGGK